MKLMGFLPACVALFGFCLSVQAAEGKKVGDNAPVFSAKDETGKVWKSTDHVGNKILVVYFYPADMTGGCTKQACGFRDDMSKLKEMDVEVIGVSGDSVENHQVFKKAHDLNFTLLADTEGKVAEAFGVPFNKQESTVKVKIDGKEVPLVRFGSAKRWTFIIDRDGKIVHKDESVNAAADPQKVAEAIKKLKSNS